MTDFRALCVELTDALDKLNCSFNVPNQSGLVERARAALAEPELEGPTDEELLCIAAKSIEPYDQILPGEYEPETNSAVEVYGSELIIYARAVLARAALAELEPDPVAWMYQGEPSFDGTDWRETWDVTTDKRLAEFKATPDQPIPLFSIQPQRQ